MSLKSPSPIASLLCLALGIAVASASCGSQPVAPSSSASSSVIISGSTGVRTTADEVGPVTSGDEGEEPVGDEPQPPPDPAPEPPPPPPEPSPAPGPGTAPAPAPAPIDPARNPGPFPAPPPTPGVSNPPIFWIPSSHDRVLLRVEPEPVPFSGTAVPLASCRDLPHTWYYQQLIHARSGISFRLIERENYFDGRLVSRTQENIQVSGNGTSTINSRWCSAFGMAHTAQHRFRGEDETGRDIVVNGPLVHLQQNPSYVPPPPPAPRSQTQRLQEGRLLVWGD
jgi:hypothetical protein